MTLEWPRQIPTVTDGVIHLRPLEPSDVDAVLACAADPASQHFTTVPSPYRRQDAVDFVDRASAQVWPGFEVAITGADDDLVGTCGLRIRDEDSDVVAIGYMVSPAARGHGIATRATRLLIDLAWTLGAHRVTLDAFATNTASRRVAERCGMTQEGVLREAHLGNGDIRHDVVLYGMVRPDARPNDRRPTAAESSDDLVQRYLAALERADASAVLELFTPDAVVHSPLYGPCPAARFYPSLFADTGSSRLTLRGVTHGQTVDGTSLVTFWFHFDWRLPSGAAAPFDVVDVAELSDDGRIAVLRIVYDTVDVRPVFEAETGSSWRPPRDD